MEEVSAAVPTPVKPDGVPIRTPFDTHWSNLPPPVTPHRNGADPTKCLEAA